jgi:hypothetical protein
MSAFIAYEIPLTPNPQKFNINLFGTQYRFQFIYRDVTLSLGNTQIVSTAPTLVLSAETISIVEQLIGPIAVLSSGSITVASNGSLTVEAQVIAPGTSSGGWCFDMFTASGIPILAGIPLVTGIDLLEQFAYLGLGLAFFVATDEAPLDIPTFDNLGVTAHFYFMANP